MGRAREKGKGGGRLIGGSDWAMGGTRRVREGNCVLMMVAGREGSVLCGALETCVSAVPDVSPTALEPSADEARLAL